MADLPDDDVRELAGRLFDLSRRGDEELLAYLDAGAPSDLRTGDGDSLLMLVAYNGRVGLLRGLIARGADVDLPNDRGQTPLAGAVFKGLEEVVDILVSAGADPDAGTPTATETAKMFRGEDMLARLRTPPPPANL